MSRALTASVLAAFVLQRWVGRPECCIWARECSSPVAHPAIGAGMASQPSHRAHFPASAHPDRRARGGQAEEFGPRRGGQARQREQEEQKKAMIALALLLLLVSIAAQHTLVRARARDPCVWSKYGELVACELMARTRLVNTTSSLSDGTQRYPRQIWVQGQGWWP